MPHYHRAGEWEAVVAETISKKPPCAKYSIQLTFDDIRIMETECADVDAGEGITGTEIQKSRIGKHKKVFWKKMPLIIGASLGEETFYIRVELTSGSCHGRPVTKAELEKEIGGTI